MPVHRTAVAAVAALVALGAGLALYGSALRPGNTGAAAEPCAGSAAALARVDKASRGQVAGMQAPPQARPAPEFRFKGPDGADATLSDLRGRVLLVNLWATWCAPCKAEMPALDRLQEALAGPDFSVVAINVDTRNLEKPAEWLKQTGIQRLAFYADPGGRVLPAIQRDTGSTGLPTTMLIDAHGCTLGVMKGPAEWSGPDGLGLIRAALGRTT